MIAFNGYTELKTKLVEQVIWHRQQDMLICGTYGKFGDKKFRGCAVGCSLHSYGVIAGIKLNTSDHKTMSCLASQDYWLGLRMAYLKGCLKKNSSYGLKNL